MHGCEGHPVCGWWLRFQECKRLLSTCHWRAPVVMVWRVSVGLPGGCFCFGWVVGLGLAGFCGPLGRVPLLRVGGWPRVGCGGCGDAVSHFHCFSRLKRAKMNPSPDPADPADPPDPADPVHGLPLGTSPTRAGGQDDVSSQANSLKLRQLVRNSLSQTLPNITPRWTATSPTVCRNSRRQSYRAKG